MFQLAGHDLRSPMLILEVLHGVFAKNGLPERVVTDTGRYLATT